LTRLSLQNNDDYRILSIGSDTVIVAQIDYILKTGFKDCKGEYQGKKSLIYFTL